MTQQPIGPHYTDGTGTVRLGAPRIGGNPPMALCFQPSSLIGRLEAKWRQECLMREIKESPGYADLCGAILGR